MPTTGTGRSCRVLVVDDDVDVAITLVDLLRAWGHDAHAAFDEMGALQSVWSRPPDVMILDVGLPRVSGAQLAATLVHLPGMQDARTVFLTGFDPALVAGLLPPHHALLLKPADPEQLRGVLFDGR